MDDSALQLNERRGGELRAALDEELPDAVKVHHAGVRDLGAKAHVERMDASQMREACVSEARAKRKLQPVDAADVRYGPHR